MVGVGSAALFATLSWCATRSGAGVQCEGSALERLLRGRFCEEALGAPICPEKFFAYLDVRLSLWSVAFPSCSTFTPTMYGDVLNEFAIMASTDVKSDADYDVGALLLRFENTTSRDPAWSSLADDRMCSVECMSRRRDSGSIRVASLSVQCPTDDNIANMLPLSSCAAAEASLMLHPEGRTVADGESEKEGAMCDWSEAPHIEYVPRRSYLPAQLSTMLMALLVPGLLGGKSYLLAKMLDSRCRLKHT